MKWGFRRPSIRKRIAARTSWKRVLRHSIGLKAPRGWGWLTNPRRAAYNWTYRRTSFGIEDLAKILSRGRSGCALFLVAPLAVMAVALGALLLGWPRSG